MTTNELLLLLSQITGRLSPNKEGQERPAPPLSATPKAERHFKALGGALVSVWEVEDQQPDVALREWVEFMESEGQLVELEADSLALLGYTATGVKQGQE